MMNVRLIIGSIIVLIGISLLFDVQLLRFVFPLLLIILGLSVVFGKRSIAVRSGTVREDTISRVLVFSGIDATLQSDNFKGGEIVAIFGGGELDLSKVSSATEKVELDLVAVFGGLKIIIPKNWSVKTEGVGILGGFNNQSQPDKKTTTLLVAKGVAIFGGVDIVS